MRLGLGHNRLTLGTAWWLARLTGLQSLALEHNRLIAIPVTVGVLSALAELTVFGNPLRDPPRSVLAGGAPGAGGEGAVGPGISGGWEGSGRRRERESEKEGDRDSDRDRETETETETERQSTRHRERAREAGTETETRQAESNAEK